MSEYGLRQQDYETIKALKKELADLRARLEKAERDAASKQSQIDELMLEYCPDEMTPEQIEEWAKHQEPVISAITKERKLALPE